MQQPEIANQQERKCRNGRVFGRAALFTLPVIGGYGAASHIALNGNRPDVLMSIAIVIFFAMLAAAMLTASRVFQGVLWLAQKAPTPFLRFAATFGLLALPGIFFWKPTIVAVPLMLLAVVLCGDSTGRRRRRRGFHAAQSYPSPYSLAVLRLFSQALCGAVLAFLFALSETIGITNGNEIFWAGIALVANAWFWLIVLIARTAWKAAVEPERHSV